MSKDVITSKKDITLKEASDVMSKLHIGCLVITEEEKIIGILTRADIIKSVANDRSPNATLAEEIMSKNVLTVDQEKSMEDAVNMMLDRKIKRMPVVSEGKLVGMVTASDIMVVEPKLIASIASIISLNASYTGG